MNDKQKKSTIDKAKKPKLTSIQIVQDARMQQNQSELLSPKSNKVIKTSTPIDQIISKKKFKQQQNSEEIRDHQQQIQANVGQKQNFVQHQQSFSPLQHHQDKLVRQSFGEDPPQPLLQTPVTIKRKGSFADRFSGRTSMISKDQDLGITQNTNRPIVKLGDTNSSKFTHLLTNAGQTESGQIGNGQLTTPKYSLRNHRIIDGTPTQSFGHVSQFSGASNLPSHLLVEGNFNNKIVVIRKDSQKINQPFGNQQQAAQGSGMIPQSSYFGGRSLSNDIQNQLSTGFTNNQPTLFTDSRSLQTGQSSAFSGSLGLNMGNLRGPSFQTLNQNRGYVNLPQQEVHSYSNRVAPSLQQILQQPNQY